MENVLTNALEQGFIYAFMILGVFLSFRLLGFPDLTVEGSFPFGAAVGARLLVQGWAPLPAAIAASLAGVLAGLAAGAIHTKLKVNNILAGILTASALYTFMLRVMGRPNTPLLNYPTAVDQIESLVALPPGTWTGIAVLGVMAVVARLLLGWFLATDLGLAIRATGNNEGMIRSLGVNTDTTKIITLGISNGMVAFSGALASQIQGFADVGMGIGALVAAVASVIIGETIFGVQALGRVLTGVVVGSVIYRALITLGLRLGLPPTDFKLITAGLVLLALSVPLLKSSGAWAGVSRGGLGGMVSRMGARSFRQGGRGHD